MKMVEIKCNGDTNHDCLDCGKYFSLHSLHYSCVHKKKVSEISCSIGGNRVFDENGERVGIR